MAEIKVPFHRAAITKAEEDAVLDVLRSGWLTTGRYALEFEKKFSAAVSGDDSSKGRAPVISLAVNSNTSGMILAMEACGVREGTAVITTPYTFVSTAACARHLNADVFFADVEKDTYSIDPDKIEEILKKDSQPGGVDGKGANRVRAIVPVHIAGNVCDMARIMELAGKYSAPERRIRVIEDAAHSFPSPTALGYAGTIGDAGVFSFYVTKTITTAEGGMVCTRDPDLAHRMTVMRMHGMDRTTWDRYTSPRASWEYDIIAPGYKFNLPDVLAAIGCCQVDRAQLFYEQRKRIVEKYNKAFSSLDFIKLPPDGEGNSWHLYLMRIIPEKLKIGRDEFAKKLQESGLGISVHFIPIFHFTYWKELYPDFTAENFPNAEHQYNTTISIPLYPDMTDEQAQLVIDTVTKIGVEAKK
ncbi:dTDP-4-amino-4,6-dideoxygalactose transaminase [Treponema bryantii]|uniref:dTDP-4-amino-4,6-dideoxygalactose transaminase n=1 Tax=Treponema bryantii TaxID=163 RepID=A0A1H9A7M7_9SPIR|nr:DegT/DnrJ/EryC1/StrS aminotransferase family protein [Treponema bryantii]SEP72453.1 dTDP-4-amino-4,6-dideoxygalactose transaminase [Treponema bryantii]